MGWKAEASDVNGGEIKKWKVIQNRVGKLGIGCNKQGKSVTNQEPDSRTICGRP